MMKNDPIPRVVGKLFIPFTLVFSLYVQFHGDFGPGGGFQAGVIFSGALILYSLIFGITATQNLIPLICLIDLIVLSLIFSICSLKTFALIAI